MGVASAWSGVVTVTEEDAMIGLSTDRLWLDLVLFTPIVFLGATVLGDVLHVFLHRWERSRIALLRWAADLHRKHHVWFDESLAIHPSLKADNRWGHILPEYVSTVVFAAVFFVLAPWTAVVAAITIHTVLFLVRVVGDGRDVNHQAVTRLKAIKQPWWVSPDYHFSHHRHPRRFYGSFLGVVDIVLGTAGPKLAGRRVAVTGASGAFGAALAKRLERRGVTIIPLKHGRDFTPNDYERVRPFLADCDMLVLAHGAKSDECMNANHLSFCRLIDVFLQSRQPSMDPPEIWALGSEAEWHGDFLGLVPSLKPYAASKRAFARRARALLADHAIAYRHIVPSAFSSRMGPGLMSADFAAAYALALIDRGMAYVPVTYTGMAWLNWFRMKAIQPKVRRAQRAFDQHAAPRASKPAM